MFKIINYDQFILEKSNTDDISYNFNNKVNIGLIGGAESPKTLQSVLTELNSKKILVITTATKYKKEAEEKYSNIFKRLGYYVDFIHASVSDELDTPENIDKLNIIDTIFFTGGDQSRISKCFLGTRFLNEMISKKITLVGTSAGSMVLSHNMISGGVKEPIMSIGLSILPDVIIDTHYKERERSTRLEVAVKLNGGIGCGISEDSAIVIKDGNMVTFGDVDIKNNI